MSDGRPLTWRASMGGYVWCWRQQDQLKTAADALRLKPWQVGVAVTALGGRQEMAIARLVLGAAAGRPIRDNLGPADLRVADEADVTLRVATDTDVDSWEAQQRLIAALKPGRGRKRRHVDQLGLGL